MTNRVTGIGGVFFKSKDPQGLKSWYHQHLGITPIPGGPVIFQWREVDRPDEMGYTVWEPFPHDTTYFDPSAAPFMINYRVSDLHALLEQLRQEGVQVEDRIEESEYGKFGWIMDPEGNRIELWEPPRSSESQ